MAKRVLLVTRDLLFRSKLQGVVAAAGAEVSRDEAACDLAVLELGRPGPNAVLVARLDVAGVHGRRQGKAALERAIRPFVAVYQLRALLGDLLLRTTDRENIVLERDLHILGFDTRQLGDDADRLGILEDVHGWHPRGLGAVAVQAAQHVEDPVADRVPLKRTSGNEHCHYSFHCRSELLLLASGLWQPACRSRRAWACQLDNPGVQGGTPGCQLCGVRRRAYLSEP